MKNEIIGSKKPVSTTEWLGSDNWFEVEDDTSHTGKSYTTVPRYEFNSFPTDGKSWEELCDLFNACGDGYDETKKQVYIHKTYRLNDNRAFLVTEKKRTGGIDIPGGVYTFEENYGWDRHAPFVLRPKLLRNDKYFHLPIYNEISTDISNFIEADIYKDLGILKKRGYLLYGKPGDGKTTYIRLISKKLISENNALVVFFNDDIPPPYLMKSLKNDNRLKVFVFEELVATVESTGKLSQLLDVLDGESSLDNCIVLATTNYPEKLPGNIVDRPSRFDRVIKVQGHELSVKVKFLESLQNEPVEKEEISLLDTKSISLALIKECFIRSRINKISFSEAFRQLKKQSAVAKKDFSETEEMGFFR